MTYKVLAFDIGGKAIKYTIFSKQKWLFQPLSVKISKATGKQVLAIIKQIYNQQKVLINGIAISSCGAIDENGTICGPSAIQDFFGFNLKAQVAKMLAFQGPIVILNDGNAATYANYSTVEPGSTVVTIAVGTGVGGGVVVNGQLVFGKNGFGGETGIMVLAAPAISEAKALQTCSQISGFYHLEQYYQQLAGSAREGKAIFKLYDQGDKNATTAVTRMYHGLATTILNIAVLLDPDYIFISGGLASRQVVASELTSYVDNLQQKLNLNLPRIVIKNSPFLSHSQLYGVYNFFLDAVKKEG